MSRRCLNGSLNVWEQGQTCSFKWGVEWTSTVVGLHFSPTGAFDFTPPCHTFDCCAVTVCLAGACSQNASNPNLYLISSLHIISEMRLPVSLPAVALCCFIWLTAHVSAAHYLAGTALQEASWLFVTAFHPHSIISFVLPDSLSSFCETFHQFSFFFHDSELQSTRKVEKNKQLPTQFHPCCLLRGSSLATASSYSSVPHNLLSAPRQGSPPPPCYNTPQQD